MTQEKQIVTRFPPSPTGLMHIGNARTALFNWLYARANGGKFLIRIEDTDRKRHSEEAVQVILDGLEWLGLNYDNEPQSQFANRQRHIEVANQLLATGKAYKCYCSPEELAEMRESGNGYNRKWRDNTDTPPEGIDPVIRIKAPMSGETTIHDEVQGDVTVKNDQLDDFIILRSDNTPTYMLSVVVDDHDMGITHIIRGDDHLNNAFRQKVIFDAMEWATPIFAHTPLIHGADGAKFSKRHGAQSIKEYADMGFLPEAMRNYLMRLGWGHGDEEIIPDAKALELFDLSGIGKAAAKFDFAKLENLNAHYINELSAAEMIAHLTPIYAAQDDLTFDTQTQKWITEHSDELKSRSKTLPQLAEDASFYAKRAPFAYDAKADALLDQDGVTTLSHLKTALETLSDWNESEIQNACKSIAGEHKEGKLGKVAMPLRAALTGTTTSPSIFKAAEILGREEALTRLNAAINRL
ncbi:MAG: glutamate--tRNA ligase [Alphaproteobacteria bacterium]